MLRPTTLFGPCVAITSGFAFNPLSDRIRLAFVVLVSVMSINVLTTSAVLAQPVASAATKQLAWPEEELREGKIAAPNLNKATKLFHDSFDNPESGFPRGADGNIEHDYDNGKYVITVPGRETFSIWRFPSLNPFLNCAIQMTGRAVGTDTDCWGLRINSYPFHWVNVTINNKGELFVDPNDDLEPGRGPRIGPIKHPAIKTNEKSNTLLLVIRGRVMEIYVNDVAVCDPVTSDRDMTPCLFSLRTSRPGAPPDKPEMRVELDQVTIWSADGLKKPEARGAVTKTVTPATPVPGELLSGQPLLVGDLGDAKLVEERFTLSDNAKAKFAIEDKLYQVRAKSAGHHRADVSKLNKVSNFACMAFAKLDFAAKGGWGLSFGDNAAGRFEAQLREEGGTRQIHLAYVNKEGEDDVIPWMSCPSARAMSQFNALRVEANGKVIRLFVNGLFVAEKEDSRLVPGGIHPLVFAEEAPVDARFSFMHVWRLKPATTKKPADDK